MGGFMEIPAEDLTRQYQQIKYEVWAAMEAVLPTGKYTLGPTLRAFEEEFAAYCGVQCCLGISNGTEALHLALVALGIGSGDEVITVANTYVATAFAVSYVGATPVFVDIDPVTYMMDLSKVEEKITARTRAIIPVHLYGHPVDMDPLLEIAQRHGLRTVEDAAQSQGALYKGRKTGALSDIGCFSFYPSKNLGCYGDGGGVTTDDPDLCEKLQVLRYMGQHVKHTHEIIGFQQRLDPLQAAILRVKLRHLDTWSDALRDWLAKRGIGTQIIYGTPVPLQRAYQHLGYTEADIPVAVQCAKELLCLPMFPELREEEVRAVAGAIREFYTARS